MHTRLLLCLPLALTFLGSLAVEAQECTARVEHTGNIIQGNRVYSRWLIGHTPWRWATVTFRYQLTYVDKDNKEGTVAGRFRQLISSADEEYVELKNLRSHPTFVTKTKISDINCEQ